MTWLIVIYLLIGLFGACVANAYCRGKAAEKAASRARAAKSLCAVSDGEVRP